MIFATLADRNKFIESNMKLVISRIMKLNKGIFDNDLYQVGSLALIEATDRFDKSKGFLFSTYAAKYIDGCILRYKRYDSLIKPIRKNAAEWCFQYKDIGSLDAPVKNSKTTYIDILYEYDKFEDDVVSDVFVNGFLESLSERDRQIINFLINNKTQHEISKIIGISQSRVSILIKGISEKYKRYQRV